MRILNTGSDLQRPGVGRTVAGRPPGILFVTNPSPEERNVSAFSQLAHMLVDKAGFHDESQLKEAHALVEDSDTELGLKQPESVENDEADSEDSEAE